VFPLDGNFALGAGVAHVCQVVLLTVDVVVELVVGSLYHNAAHTASSLGLLEMLLTYWFVLKEQVGVSQRLIAHMALHAGGVVEGLVVHHAVPDYLLLADAALLLGVLETFSTVSIVIFRVEFAI